LAQITSSVFVHPSMADHFYLQSQSIPWLSMEERKAIGDGFRMAMARQYGGSGPAYAAFCAALEHHAAAADTLSKLSSSSDQPSQRVEFLLEAGSAYARSGEIARAQQALEQAARIMPSDPAPYQALLTEVFARRKDLEGARAAIRTGLENGADPFALYVSLANLYEQAGDLNGAEQALLKAAWLRPEGRYDYDGLMRMADLERRSNHLERAELWMRRAIELRPGAADALYQLALLEVSDYEYGQALSDLSKALKLAPGNTAMQSHYQDLLRMIAAQSRRNSR
jgi:tetratricopeptide (TPR) repeat protein